MIYTEIVNKIIKIGFIHNITQNSLTTRCAGDVMSTDSIIFENAKYNHGDIQTVEVFNIDMFVPN